jgi:prophage regulatory protein
VRHSSPSPRRLRIEQAGQYDLPFPAEAVAFLNAAETDPKPELPPAHAAGKLRASRNSKTPVRRAPRRNERNRKPPAREALAPNGPQPKNPQETPVEVQFLRLPEVKAVTGLGKTSIYELIRDKSFPAPVRLGARAVAWVRSEVTQWALERVHSSRSVA